MDIEAGRRVADTLKEDTPEEPEAKEPSKRYRLDWIALAGLLVTVLLILGSGVSSNTQTQDKVANIESDFKDHKKTDAEQKAESEKRLRQVEDRLTRFEGKMDRIGDRLGLHFSREER